MLSPDFADRLHRNSDAELRAMIVNVDQYVPEAVDAARNESRSRNPSRQRASELLNAAREARAVRLNDQRKKANQESVHSLTASVSAIAAILIKYLFFQDISWRGLPIIGWLLYITTPRTNGRRRLFSCQLPLMSGWRH
jgi:hypothetical protein